MAVGPAGRCVSMFAAVLSRLTRSDMAKVSTRRGCCPLINVDGAKEKLVEETFSTKSVVRVGRSGKDIREDRKDHRRPEQEK